MRRRKELVVRGDKKWNKREKVGVKDEGNKEEEEKGNDVTSRA